MPTKSKILIFDGECILCNSLMKFLWERVKKKKYLFVPSKSELGKKYIEEYELHQIINDTVVVIRNETIYMRGDAVLILLDDMPKYWNVLKLFKIFPKVIINWMYDLIAKNRNLILKNNMKDTSCKIETY